LNIVSGATEQTIRQSATTVARVRPSLYLEEMARYTGGACVSIFGSEAFRPQPWAANGERDTKLWVGRALARVVDELHQAYTLRFSPAALDGRLHALEVRVTKPGLTVRARRGYLAPRAVIVAESASSLARPSGRICSAAAANPLESSGFQAWPPASFVRDDDVSWSRCRGSRRSIAPPRTRT
jgi:hypothetical protein